MTFKNSFTQRTIGSVMLGALIVGGVATTAPSADAQTRSRRTRRPVYSTRTARSTNTAPRVYNLRASETIRVRMNDELSSSNARVGQRFTTTVVDPVYADGTEVIPAGSKVTGRITEVKRAARRKAGTMSVAFVSVTMPNNRTYTIDGALTETERDTVNVDNESEVEGRSTTKRDVIFIGGGAGTGAAIGAIAGGGKGAGIGAGIGAGLGVAGSLFSKGEEAKVKAGTEFGVVLNRSVALPASMVR